VLTFFGANVLLLKPGDIIGFSFFVSFLALLATSVFLFIERFDIARTWKTPMSVSILITLVAAVQYFYMRTLWAETATSPTQLRYIDWIITVPLLCLQFYQVLRPYGASPSVYIRLLLGGLIMIITGYIGQTIQLQNNIIWGFISSLAWAFIVFEVYGGEAADVARYQAPKTVRDGFNALRLFIVFGWSIYPIGFMLLPGNFLNFLVGNADLVMSSPMDLIYNIGDCVNKIGFSLVVYSIAYRDATARLAAKQ